MNAQTRTLLISDLASVLREHAEDDTPADELRDAFETALRVDAALKPHPTRKCFSAFGTDNDIWCALPLHHRGDHEGE